MRKSERINIRREQVEQCLSSSLGVTEWCRLNKVGVTTMYEWRKYFRDNEPEVFKDEPVSHGDWIELDRRMLVGRTMLGPCQEDILSPRVATDLDEPPIEMIIGGIRISVPAGVSADRLMSVLRVVTSL